MRTRLRAPACSTSQTRSTPGSACLLEDGLRLFEHPDLRLVGWLANRERERRHGDRTFYNYNLRLEVTNVCQASCLFCSFARLQEGEPGAYTMSLEQAWDKVRSREGQALTEVHIVNGLHPHLPFSYYTDLLAGFKRIRPDITLKAFTAVEIAFFADLYGMTDEQVLARADGGGARVDPGRWRRDLRRPRAQEDRQRQGRRGSLPVDPRDRASPRHEDERDDAVRAHRAARRARGPHGARPRARRTRRAASRRSSR